MICITIVACIALDDQIMPGHLSTRIFHAATMPLVRSAGPAVGKAAKHLTQFIGFTTIGIAIILAAWITNANGLPWPLIKTLAITLAAIPIGFGLLIVLEQIRLTYTKQDPSVYEAVEPFEQRRPHDG